MEKESKGSVAPKPETLNGKGKHVQRGTPLCSSPSSLGHEIKISCCGVIGAARLVGRAGGFLLLPRARDRDLLLRCYRRSTPGGTCETTPGTSALTVEPCSGRNLWQTAGPPEDKQCQSAADGKWQMANGKWQMADGKWQMADGRWQMADGRWLLLPS